MPKSSDDYHVRQDALVEAEESVGTAPQRVLVRCMIPEVSVWEQLTAASQKGREVVDLAAVK